MWPDLGQFHIPQEKADRTILFYRGNGAVERPYLPTVPILPSWVYSKVPDQAEGVPEVSSGRKNRPPVILETVSPMSAFVMHKEQDSIAREALSQMGEYQLSWADESIFPDKTDINRQLIYQKIELI